jgi:hypothetical protein
VQVRGAVSKPTRCNSGCRELYTTRREEKANVLLTALHCTSLRAGFDKVLPEFQNWAKVGS